MTIEQRDVVVVTGANSGIGLHLVAALLANRYRVAALDLAGENLTALLAAYPDRLLFCRCDVASDADVTAAVETVVQRWGRIDILVNNAAQAVFAPFAEQGTAAIRRAFEVNYFGVVRLILAVLPHMRARRRGVIHNVSSAVGITGFPGLAGYTSTKGAIEALTRTLAIELASDGIVVNLIHPPLTRTAAAMPLGVPPLAMADPAVVGRKLAKQIGSTRPVITPDLQTAVFLFLARCWPTALGKLLARLTERARAGRAGARSASTST